MTNLLYLALRTEPMPAGLKEYLETAELELRRVANITSKTLGFHKQATHPVAVLCQSLFADTLLLYQSRLVSSRIEIEKRKRAKRSVICFDGEIRQVLSNLVGNAVDAMQERRTPAAAQPGEHELEDGQARHRADGGRQRAGHERAGKKESLRGLLHHQGRDGQWARAVDQLRDHPPSPGFAARPQQPAQRPQRHGVYDISSVRSGETVGSRRIPQELHAMSRIEPGDARRLSQGQR